MPGPGEYRPDPSQGITRIEDLPKPKIRCQSRNYRRRPCPRCGQSAYRSLSEYLLVLSHGRWISLGFGLFGLGPTLCAHYPPQSTPTLQERRQIFKRLWVKQISCHSADTFSRPRNRNLRIPRADLIMPNTGSTMCLRAA